MRILLLSSLKISIFLIFFVGCIVPVLEVFAYPEGEVYWATEDYPDQTFPYDPEDADSYSGAIAALDYACQKKPSSNPSAEYTGEVNIEDINFAAEKGGWCRVRYPGFPTTFNGATYTAYLYCNGVKFDRDNESPSCEPPIPVLDPNKNLGKPPCQ